MVGIDLELIPHFGSKKNLDSKIPAVSTEKFFAKDFKEGGDDD